MGMTDVPSELQGRPVTTRQCRAAGLDSRRQRRLLQPMLRSVWWWGPLPTSWRPWVTAALLVLPHDVVVTHVTALWMHGVEIGSLRPLHLSIERDVRCTHDAIVLHRPRWLRSVLRDGFRVTTPQQSFVDSATILSLRDLVRAGDALVRRGLTTPSALIRFCRESSANGVARATQAASLVRERVDSFRETDLRLLLHCAGLPEAICNAEIFCSGGFLARSDLVYRSLRIAIEYDGWYHDRSAAQRRKDVLRRERLEAAGWVVIVVTSTDLDDPLGLARRVHRVLARRGHRDQLLPMKAIWDQWSAMRSEKGAPSEAPRAPSPPIYETAVRPSKARPRVISSAYSRSPPTGRPLASLLILRP